MNEELEEIIVTCIKEINETLGYEISVSEGETSIIYGPNAALDSIGLVTLITTLEEALEDRFGLSDVVLANERAFSQAHSPFRTIGTLVDYIQEEVLLQNDKT